MKQLTDEVCAWCGASLGFRRYLDKIGSEFRYCRPEHVKLHQDRRKMRLAQLAAALQKTDKMVR